jgi:hypothetical protein
MPKIPLSKVQPGQRIARAVVNANGVVMVQPGTELTSSMIERLRSVGVDAVVVASGDEPTVPTRPVHERLGELDARFAGHENDPVMMQIKDVVARQLKGGHKSGHA